MNNAYNKYPCSNYGNMPWYNSNMMYDSRRMYPYSYFYPMYNPGYMNGYQTEYPYDVTAYNTILNNHIHNNHSHNNNNNHNNNVEIDMMDYGPEPFAVNINEATKQNDNFRTALWTGDHMQLTLMSINVGENIGLEMHPDVDQFIRIEEGEGIVRMGNTEDLSELDVDVYDDFAFVIPAGTWHNLFNTGNVPLKLYSIYAPPQHPHGTVHETKEDSEAAH